MPQNQNYRPVLLQTGLDTICCHEYLIWCRRECSKYSPSSVFFFFFHFFLYFRAENQHIETNLNSAIFMWVLSPRTTLYHLYYSDSVLTSQFQFELHRAQGSHCPVVFHCWILWSAFKKSYPRWRLSSGVILYLYCLLWVLACLLWAFVLPLPITFENLIRHIVLILMFWFISNNVLTGRVGRLKASLSAWQQPPAFHQFVTITRDKVCLLSEMPNILHLKTLSVLAIIIIALQVPLIKKV